jgi:hypothetical protein
MRGPIDSQHTEPQYTGSQYTAPQFTGSKIYLARCKETFCDIAVSNRPLKQVYITSPGVNEPYE